METGWSMAWGSWRTMRTRRWAFMAEVKTMVWKSSLLTAWLQLKVISSPPAGNASMARWLMER